jgi:flagellar basal body-associated protein FliL
MNKKIIISIVIVLILVAVYFFFFNKAEAPATPEVKAVEASTQAQSSVSSGVQKTNPFNVNVSPYEGYKNPFQ